MKNLLIVLLCAFTLITGHPDAASAFEKAAPLGFIYKTGSYTANKDFIADKKFSVSITSKDNSSVTFTLSQGCVFSPAASDDKGTEIYTAPLQAMTLRAGAGEPEESRGRIELLCDTASLELKWRAAAYAEAAPRIFSRPLSGNEYKTVMRRSSITVEPGGDALIIQYGGIRPDKKYIIFHVTDTAADDVFQTKLVPVSSLPAYYRLAGGVIRLEKTVTEDGAACLLYEWFTKPARLK